jgi:hypothetical protein
MRTSTETVRDPDVRTACETYTDFVHQHLDHSKGKYMIEQSRKPSLDDILWVKRDYPWKVLT